jgi:uridine kinase
MHHEFLEPTKQYADIIVGEETDIAADVLAARVQQVLGELPSEAGSIND